MFKCQNHLQYEVEGVDILSQLLWVECVNITIHVVPVLLVFTSWDLSFGPSDHGVGSRKWRDRFGTPPPTLHIPHQIPQTHTDRAMTGVTDLTTGRVSVMRCVTYFLPLLLDTHGPQVTLLSGVITENKKSEKFISVP